MTDRLVDIAAHLGNRNYSRATMMLRFVWSVAAFFFWLTPRLGANKFRNAILRAFGAKIGSAVRIHPSVSIAFPWNLSVGDNVVIGPGVTLYCLGKVEIGDNVMISQRAHLCAGDHDWRKPNLPLLTPPIFIEPETWIGAEAFVGGGARIRRGSICGARSVVFGDTQPRSIMVGNPARAYRRREA